MYVIKKYEEGRKGVQTMLIPAKNHKGIELASSFLQYLP